MLSTRAKYFVNSGRIQRLDVVKQNMEGWHMIQYPASTSINGDKMWIVYAQDDVGNIIKWLYFIPHSRDMVMRVWIHSGD